MPWAWARLGRASQDAVNYHKLKRLQHLCHKGDPRARGAFYLQIEAAELKISKWVKPGHVSLAPC